MGGEGGEFIGCGDEGESGEFGDFASSAFGKLGVRIESGADGGSAEGEFVNGIEGLAEAFEILVKLHDVAGEFLAEGERNGVHQVSATDFDDVVELDGFGMERLAELCDSGNESVDELFGGGDVHGRGEGVVGRLGHVDVVVGMNRFFGSHDSAGDFNGAVGDDLIGIHVGLGAAPGLPDAERKMVIEFSGDDFVGGLFDEGGEFGRKLAEVSVDEGG